MVVMARGERPPREYFLHVLTDEASPCFHPVFASQSDTGWISDLESLGSGRPAFDVSPQQSICRAAEHEALFFVRVASAEGPVVRDHVREHSEKFVDSSPASLILRRRPSLETPGYH